MPDRPILSDRTLGQAVADSTREAVTVRKLRSGEISVLNVLDLSGFLHIIRHNLEAALDVAVATDKAVETVKYALHWAQNCGMCPVLNEQASRCHTLWVCDEKMPIEGLTDMDGEPCDGYWRHKYYEGYKKGRPSRPLIKVMRDLFFAQNLPYIQFTGYEADDIAGVIAKLWQGAEARGKRLPATNLLMWSSDRDWQQLVQGDSTLWVDWVNRRDKEDLPKPTILDREGVHWALTDQMTRERLKWKKARYQVPEFNDDFTAEEVIKMKVLIGDDSDKLFVRTPRKPDYPETIPRFLIDLYEPHPEWSIWGDAEKMTEVKKAILQAVKHKPKYSTLECLAKLTALPSTPSSKKLLPLTLLK